MFAQSPVGPLYPCADIQHTTREDAMAPENPGADERLARRREAYRLNSARRDTPAIAQSSVSSLSGGYGSDFTSVGNFLAYLVGPCRKVRCFFDDSTLPVSGDCPAGGCPAVDGASATGISFG